MNNAVKTAGEANLIPSRIAMKSLWKRNEVSRLSLVIDEKMGMLTGIVERSGTQSTKWNGNGF